MLNFWFSFQLQDLPIVGYECQRRRRQSDHRRRSPNGHNRRPRSSTPGKWLTLTQIFSIRKPKLWSEILFGTKFDFKKFDLKLEIWKLSFINRKLAQNTFVTLRGRSAVQKSLSWPSPSLLFGTFWMLCHSNLNLNFVSNYFSDRWNRDEFGWCRNQHRNLPHWKNHQLETGKSFYKFKVENFQLQTGKNYS